MNTFHFKSLVSLYILSRIIDGFFVQRPHVIRLEIFVWLHNQVIHDGWSQSCRIIGIISDLQHKNWELMSNQSIRRGVDPGLNRSNMLWFATRPFLVLFLHSRPECPFFFFCSHFSPATPRQRSQSQKTMTRHGQQWGNCTESEDSTAAMGMVRTQWGLIKMENGNWRGWNQASWLWSWQVPLWNTRHGMDLRRTSGCIPPLLSERLTALSTSIGATKSMTGEPMSRLSTTTPTLSTSWLTLPTATLDTAQNETWHHSTQTNIWQF